MRACGELSDGEAAARMVCRRSFCARHRNGVTDERAVPVTSGFKRNLWKFDIPAGSDVPLVETITIQKNAIHRALLLPFRHILLWIRVHLQLPCAPCVGKRIPGVVTRFAARCRKTSSRWAASFIRDCGMRRTGTEDCLSLTTEAFAAHRRKQLCVSNHHT